MDYLLAWQIRGQRRILLPIALYKGDVSPAQSPASLLVTLCGWIDPNINVGPYFEVALRQQRLILLVAR